MTQASHRHSYHRKAFTLVEILVVIAIIGILTSIAIPAITAAIGRANETASKLEVDALARAIEQYAEKYGDYPPDFSSWPVVERHYRKIFPRMAQGELDRLRLLTDVDTLNDTVLPIPTTFPAHNSNAMDRAEALTWALLGFSDNPQLPFTGAGGPLEQVAATAMSVTFQINTDRPNKLYDFDFTRLSLSEINDTAAVSATNRYVSTDDTTSGDLFLTYKANDDGAPFVYFDSRTYDALVATPSTFNGFSSTAFGSVRPYYSTIVTSNVAGSDYGSLAAALRAWKFMNPDSFQIIAPGRDNRFGSTFTHEFDSSSAGAEPLYFQFPTGEAIAPSGAMGINLPGELKVSGVAKYDETSVFGATESFHLDNITNFSTSTLESDLE